MIKILFQDDYLHTATSLAEIAECFDLEKDKWLVTACEHSLNGIDCVRPFYPKYNKKIYLGKNTISSPSVLTIINDDPLLFDDNLIWLMDCDYYKRCYDRYGEPKILNKINVVNRVGSHQVTSTLVDDESVKKEVAYVKNKYRKIWFTSMLRRF